MTGGHGIAAGELRDAWPLAGKVGGNFSAPRVVRPSSAEEVAPILKLCAERGEVVVPAGGRSGVSGALMTSRADVVLDMTSLNRILEIDPASGTVTVEAGILGSVLEETLSAQGFTCGHYPQSLALSTVGGWLATRGIGTFSNKYGGIENIVVACEIAFPDGRTARFGGAPRSAAGPRLIELFIGSEGTFGVVTRITLKMHRKAESLKLVAYACPSLEAGIEEARRMFDVQTIPALLRLYDAAESGHLYEKAHVEGELPLLIVGHEGESAMASMEEKVVGAALKAKGFQNLGPAIAESWIAGRYRAEWLEKGNERPDQIADSIEVSVGWRQLMPLYERVTADLGALVTWQMAHLSHFYHSGSMFYFIFGLEDDDQQALIERYRKAWAVVQDHALALGGTCTHHHGVGLIRKDAFKRELGPVAHDLLRGIKRAIDPNNTLNPSALALDEEC
ncbi:D-lactate dehydrogenase (cytochrome) [Aquamicrobium terrae]